MCNETIKSMEQMVAERSEFGAKKYQVPNPDPTGPWGDGETVELFWFRNLVQDMREELADAEVYAQRLTACLDAHVDTPTFEGAMKDLVRDLLLDYSAQVAHTFAVAQLIEELLQESAPELVTDQTEYWGQFSKRL